MRQSLHDAMSYLSSYISVEYTPTDGRQDRKLEPVTNSH